MGLSWKIIREGFAALIQTAVPTAIVKDEWPYNFSTGDAPNGLTSDTEGGRVHAYLIGSMRCIATETRIGGGDDHGSFESVLEIRFMGLLGNYQGSSTTSSADEFEDELKEIRRVVQVNRRNLGITHPDIDELRRVYPVRFEDIYIDDHGDALVNIAEGNLQLQLIERW